MEHFPEQAWADFVRGISKSETTISMTSHLASGCTDCTAVLDVWKRVHAIASTESTYTPPEDRVRMMRVEFEARNRARKPEPVTAKLIFDTLAQPLTAGIRAAAATARQLVYEAEGLTVDVRLEAQPQSKTVLAVGQILDKRTPLIPSTEASVTLWTEKGLPLIEIRPNQFGEFHLEFEAQDNLRLSVTVLGRTPILIPLANLR
jgi:hypothetical protein